MTDELSIQAQQPQRTSPMPYVLGGAAVGAAAGGFSPVGVTKPKYSSYEDILKESEDTFDKGIKKGGDNKSFWEAAKEHAEKVKNAESEYDKKVQEIKDAHKSAASELPETEQAAKDLKAAQQAYDDALKAEKTKLSSKGGGIRGSIPPADSLDTKLSRKELKTYNAIRDEYQQKLKDIREYKKKAPKGEYAKLSQKMEIAKGEYLINVGNWGTQYEAALAADPKLTPKKYFAVENGGKKTTIYNNVKAFYETELGKTGKYGTHPKAQKAMRTKAHELAVEQLKNMQTIAETDEIMSKIKVDTAQLTAASAKDVNEVIEKRASAYKKELDVIQDMSHKNKKTRTALIKKLTKEYGCKEDKLENVLQKRIKIAQKYDSHVQKILDASKSYKAITDIYSQQRTKYVEGELKPILEKFKKNFPELAKQKTVELSDSEIATKAEEALKDSKVATTLNEAKTAAENRAKELGLNAKELTEEELKKLLQDKGLGTKEEYTTKVRNAAKEVLEKDMGKIKTPNRWVNGAIAALALAGVGYLVAPKNKEVV